MAKKTKSKPVRVGREEASDRLVKAVISLLDTTPMNELLVDAITEHAGLASGHVLVHRYFGSRLDLLSEVAHTLAAQLVEGLHIDVETFRDVAVTGVDYLGSFSRHIGVIRKRALVINELALHGAPPELHSEKTREILDSLQLIFELGGIPTRAARATALNMLTLVSVEATLSEWIGASAEERDDLRTLTLLELGFASQISETLGWK
ncbi:MAG: TetR/AcrR family transcriptional regulator [Ilumatobacteraceae bacterium]|nr:TetR/AcrR family transcriptional regulator [Ilumatobacteraceae bacterium]